MNGNIPRKKMTKTIWIAMHESISSPKSRISNSYGRILMKDQFLSLYNAITVDLSRLPKRDIFSGNKDNNSRNLYKILLKFCGI